MRKARFWTKESEGRVRCGLCRFNCLIGEGGRGVCGVRENRHGILYTLVYGRTIAENVDPIEKKPLFHYYPGSLSYSVATVGCNFRCLHCQNADISQWPHSERPVPGHDLSPAQIVARAKAAGCRSISYTYTEPTIFYEYAFDTAVLAKEAGLGNVFVTNGYINSEPLSQIAPYLDAANVDLKGFSEKFYREVTGATLNWVLDSLRDYRRHGIWLEITTLLIPGYNDSEDQLRGIARFIRDELGAQTPWHVTAFHPTYRLLNVPATPVETLRRARAVGLEEGLHYVYTGNVPGEDGESTFCPVCSARLIERRGFRIRSCSLRTGRCSSCGAILEGRGLSEKD